MKKLFIPNIVTLRVAIIASLIIYTFFANA